MVSRKLLETFFDMEEKGVMVFHLTSAERRSAGHLALGLNSEHQGPKRPAPAWVGLL